MHEVEESQVELSDVIVRELVIAPDISQGAAACSRVCTCLDWPLPAARKTRQVSESNARDPREDAGQRHRPSGAGIPGTLPTRMGSYGEVDWNPFFPIAGGRITGASDRQQTPYRCQSRNHGLCASISSCRRFAAERSLALSGLISCASNISCSC
jgi:hypothetical protein